MTNNPRTADPILDELHAIRRRMHDDCGGDLARLVAQMRERQAESDHPIASIPVQSNQITKDCTGAADSAVPSGEPSAAAQ